MKQVKIAKQIGRPRGFDREAVLDAAMRAFWERGYEGTSMSYLAAVMGLNAPSIYAAFGDKMSLFKAAAARYADGLMQHRAKAFGGSTLKEGMRALFRNTVEFLSDRGHPSCCMTLTGALSTSAESSDARDFVAEIRRQMVANMRLQLEQARERGELAPDINVADYARYISVLLNGLAVQAANGLTKAELGRVADMAVRNLGY